jgi:hypothetical protein
MGRGRGDRNAEWGGQGLWGKAGSLASQVSALAPARHPGEHRSDPGLEAVGAR